MVFKIWLTCRLPGVPEVRIENVHGPGYEIFGNTPGPRLRHFRDHSVLVKRVQLKLCRTLTIQKDLEFIF